MMIDEHIELIPIDPQVPEAIETHPVRPDKLRPGILGVGVTWGHLNAQYWSCDLNTGF